MGPPETNITNNVDEGYDQGYYEDDFYSNKVSLLWKQLEKPAW